jgi:hypothetical protein
MQAEGLTNNPASADSGRDLIIGQKMAYAAASLAVGICAFISVLGAEKAVLAIVFGILALRNASVRGQPRLRLARFGILLGVLHIILLLVLLVVFRQEAMRFFEYLNRFQVHR